MVKVLLVVSLATRKHVGVGGEHISVESISVGSVAQCCGIGGEQIVVGSANKHL